MTEVKIDLATGMAHLEGHFQSVDLVAALAGAGFQARIVPIDVS